MKQLNSKLQLHHFGITARSLEETLDWYEEKLGFSRGYVYEVEELKMRAGFLTLGDFRVEVFEVQNSSPSPEYRHQVATNITVQGPSSYCACRQ